MPRESMQPTFRELIGGAIAVLVIGALCWSALYDQSQSSQTALVGAAGAVTGWLFRGGAQSASNGTASNNSGNGASSSTS